MKGFNIKNNEKFLKKMKLIFLLFNVFLFVVFLLNYFLIKFISEWVIESKYIIFYFVFLFLWIMFFLISVFYFIKSTNIKNN